MKKIFNTGLLTVLPISVTAFFVVYLIFKAFDLVTGLLKTVKDARRVSYLDGRGI
nr:MAG TPA: hypothetical protein [Caudoviricetes sp.]